MRGALFEAVNRENGEKLLHGPTVGQRLKEGEVAEVGLAQPVDQAKFLGHIFQLPHQPLNLAADGPEKVLRVAPLLERR